MQTQTINQSTKTALQLDNQSELQAAFRLFSEMSDQLETSYRQLEHRVEQLTMELAAANSEKLKQLAEKEKLADRLNTLHEAMPAAVIWIDQAQKILSANQTAKTIFKTSIVNENWQQVLEEHLMFDGRELIADDGSVYSYHQQSLEQEQGQVIILTDVTLSHQLQQSDYRQQRLAELGEITAGIAHQVRTPLSSALLSLDALTHPYIDAETREKSINRIKQNLHHLDQLVNDMLLYARDGEFDHHCVSVTSLLHNLEIYIQQKNYQHFTFSIISPLELDKDIVVAGSGDALLSVFISLIENASQLADENTNINVTLGIENTATDCIFRIQDNGPGLNSDECAQIFKPFYTTKKNGTGLGLAISRSIIKAHHGQLDVISEKGHGTVMTIQLKKFKSEKYMQSNSNKQKQTQSV